MSTIFKLDKDKSQEEVVNEVTNQLSLVQDEKLLNKIKKYLVVPTLQMIDWDYKQNSKLPAWLIIKSESDNTGILYSEYGFDFGNWGLVKLSNISFGMDFQWYETLEQAFLDSWMAGN